MTDPAEQQDAQRPFIEPGYYYDLSNEDYHGSFGFSSSQVKTLVEKTPAHLKHSFTAERETTVAKSVGQALHTLVLEPHKFEAEFIVPPEINRRTKAGREEWADFEKQAKDKHQTLITQKQLDEARQMAKLQTCIDGEMVPHPIAHLLLKDVIPESSVYWWYNAMDPDDDGDYRLMCKVRPDALSRLHPVVIDIKTTKDASFSGFSKDILNYKYHLSAAMYLEGVNQCKPLLQDIGFFAYTKFVFICVENFEPYLTAVYEMSPEYLDLGKQLYRLSIRKLQQGMREDWPGYPDEIRLIDPPPWGNRLHTV